MANRLANATSPYLLQHAENPVDWWEWGPGAFEEAKRRDTPILLSVGYAACHWCHVMAHESFEDETTAALLNDWFVCIKVDREERPDVDAAYMSATQALTGSGGWPMTVFVTPDGEPFYAGTYFPPQPRHGMPSFTQLFTAIHETWLTRRDDVQSSAAHITATLAARQPPSAAAPPSADDLRAGVLALAATEDRERGGFGGAPKFPPSMVLEWLIRHAARQAAPTASDWLDSPAGFSSPADDTSQTGTLATDLVDRTCRAMAFSGVADQLAGGFARYSVDAGWVVPHFEKMLYDNAQLARVYLHWWRLTGDPTGARIALETCDWMLTGLGTAQGCFGSALDADTDGVEGLTYVWTPAQLHDVLGPDDAAWAADLLAVTEHGTFEHGSSTLQLTRDVWITQERERWIAVRTRLLAARNARPQPARDDKVVLAWNALAISALAETGALLNRADLVQAAARCAEALLRLHQPEPGRWRRVSRDGQTSTAPAVLEDLGNLAEALVVLSGATGDNSWSRIALEVGELIRTDFVGPAGLLLDQGSRDVDHRVAALAPQADATDNAYPSGTSAAAGALLALSGLTGRDDFRSLAQRALATATVLARTAPRYVGAGLAVAEALLDGPREVAVVGVGEPADRLHRVTLRGSAPGLVIVRGTGESDAEPTAWPPLLADRPIGLSGALAYVCRGQVCSTPTGDPLSLAAAVIAPLAVAGSEPPQRSEYGH